jgi:hypothetical protein
MHAAAMQYASRMRVLNEGGTVAVEGDRIVFTGCDALTIVLGTGTSHVPDPAQNLNGGDPGARVAAQVEAAAQRGWQALKAEHETDFVALMERVRLDLDMAGEAAIGEMLLQSHIGEAHLLPALPAAWRNGSVTGLRATGGFEVDLVWTEGMLESATARAVAGQGEDKRRYGSKVVAFQIKPGESRHFRRELL